MTKVVSQSTASFIAEIESNPELARAAIESVFDDLEAYVRTAAGEPPTAEDLFMACLYAMLLASLAPGSPQPPAKFLKLTQGINGPRGTNFVKLLPDIRALRAWCEGPTAKYFEARAVTIEVLGSPLADSDIPF